MLFRNLLFTAASAALIAGPIAHTISSPADARTPSPTKPMDNSLCQINDTMFNGNSGFNRNSGNGYNRKASSILVTGAAPRTSMPAPPPPSMPAPPPSKPSVVAAPSKSLNNTALSGLNVKRSTAETGPPTTTNQPQIKTPSADAKVGRYGYIPRPPMPMPIPPQDREQYEGEDIASIQAVANQPVSTFAVDVDTGSYSNARRFLNGGDMPPARAVRTEEMINYFRYDYPLPKNKKQPFTVTTDMAKTPWNKNSRLLRVGLRGYDLDYKTRPAANLVFLVDVSGSMRAKNKLPLVKSGLKLLADQIRPQDRVSIVTYSGRVGTLLSPCNDPESIKNALDRMVARGGTAGGEGMKMAYATARQNYNAKSVNRIIMTTDGDFNVGIRNRDDLKKYVAGQRDKGVTLTALGFGTGNYNEALMEQIANVGNGNYAYIDNAMEARKVLEEEMSSTLFTIAKDVKIQIEFNPAYVGEYRLIGYENRLLAEEDFDNDAVDAGDIGAGHQVTAIYEIMPRGSKGWLPARRYEGNRKTATAGKKNGEMAFIKLRYKLPKGDTSRLIQKPLSASMMTRAKNPNGDMAFAAAVAAFGQKLRGDKYMGDFDYKDIRMLAGNDGDFWRQEFVKLTQLAQSGS